MLLARYSGRIYSVIVQNMLLRLQRYCFAFCGLLILLLTVQTGAHGYVLCFGQDGHVAMEVAVEGSCGPVTQCLPCEVPVADSESLDDEHQTACLDVPAEYDAALTRNDLHLEFLSSQSVSLTASKINHPAVSPPYKSWPFPRETMHSSQTLRAHRTVVLLN
jgi:hypothetical protein